MITVKEGTRPEKPPEIVTLLAASIANEKCPNPIPIKWRMSRKEDEGEGMIVIIFEHGPTIMFTEAQVLEIEAAPKVKAEEEVKPIPPNPKRKEKPNAPHLAQ